jgi:hypothetical protein
LAEVPINIFSFHLAAADSTDIPHLRLIAAADSGRTNRSGLLQESERAVH